MNEETSSDESTEPELSNGGAWLVIAIVVIILVIGIMFLWLVSFIKQFKATKCRILLRLSRNTSSANETADSELLSGQTLLHGSLYDTSVTHLRWQPWGRQPPSQCTSSQYERDVSGRLHSHHPSTTTSNATVSTVGATSHHGSVVHLDVVDHQVLHVQSLRLSVGLQVVQEHQEELARRLGPSAQIAGSLHQVALGVTTDRSVVSTERNHVLVGDHVVEVLLGLHQGHSLDGSTHLMSVLEVDGQVGTASEAACKGERNGKTHTLSGVHRSRTIQWINYSFKGRERNVNHNTRTNHCYRIHR